MFEEMTYANDVFVEGSGVLIVSRHWYRKTVHFKGDDAQTGIILILRAVPIIGFWFKYVDVDGVLKEVRDEALMYKKSSENGLNRLQLIRRKR